MIKAGAEDDLGILECARFGLVLLPLGIPGRDAVPSALLEVRGAGRDN